MANWLWGVAFLVAYVVLMQWLLPKHPVVSVLGSHAARNLALSHASVGVAVIGHRSPRQERHDLIAHFRETLPGVPIVTLLGRGDRAFSEVDFNWPADDPPQWVRMVNQALAF